MSAVLVYLDRALWPVGLIIAFAGVAVWNEVVRRKSAPRKRPPRKEPW